MKKMVVETEREELKVLLPRPYLILFRHFIGSPAAGKKELLMECSHLVDPVAVSGRKAGDR